MTETKKRKVEESAEKVSAVSLPISSVSLFKHGVGYFELSGLVPGGSIIQQSFKQSDINDVIKTLTVINKNQKEGSLEGCVTSINYESSSTTSHNTSIIQNKETIQDLLRQLRGVRVEIQSNSQPSIEGTILGSETNSKDTNINIMTSDFVLKSIPKSDITGVKILDPSAQKELSNYVVQMNDSREVASRSSARINIFLYGEMDNEIQVNYSLPVPMWKSTYRFVINTDGEKQSAIFQAWAIIDNNTDNDWVQVKLSLVTGKPVSFQYDLFSPAHAKRQTITKDNISSVTKEGESIFHLMHECTTTNDRSSAPTPTLQSLGLRRDRDRSPKRKPMARNLSRSRSRSIGLSDDSSDDDDDVGNSLLTSTLSASSTANVSQSSVKYDIDAPVTLMRGHSAMVPVVQRTFNDISDVTFWNQRDVQTPMKAILFRCDSSMLLESGPVAIYDNKGSFMGDSIIIAAGGSGANKNNNIFVPYALQLNARVNLASFAKKLPVSAVCKRLTISNDNVNMYFDEVIESTYHIENNNSSGQIDLFLEHALTNVWNGVENKTYELWESAASDANGPVPVRVLYRSSNFQCFTMFVKSGTKATFIVKEKVEVMRSEKLSAALTRDASLASFWVKHNLIDSTTERNLKNVLALIASIAEDEARIYQLKKEKDEYSHQLEQARSNLNALKGKSSEEDTSRKKFTKRMNEFDDKLTENVHVSNQLKEQKDTKGRELRKLLNGIEYNNNQEAMQV